MKTQETDDNTLDNAEKPGRYFADTMAERVITAIGGFDSRKQRAAIARMIARTLDQWADEVER